MRLQGFFQEDHVNAWLFWKGFSMVRGGAYTRRLTLVTSH